MLAAALAFALMAVFIKFGAQHFSTAELVFYRSALSGVAMYAVMRRRGISLVTRHAGMHVRRALFSVVGLVMFFHAMAELPLATAMTLNYTAPLFTVPLLLWLARERPDATVVVAIVLGFSATLMLLEPTIAADKWLAGIVGLLSGAMSAVTYYNVRELSRVDEPESRIVFYYGVFGSLGALMLAIPFGWHVPTSTTIWPLLGVAIMGTLGQIFMTRAFGQGKTLVSAVLSYSGIIFSSLFGIWIFGDDLPWSSWLAIAMIIAAGVIALRTTSRSRTLKSVLPDSKGMERCHPPRNGASGNPPEPR